MSAKGFYISETIGFSIINYNLKGFNLKGAKEQVRQGKARFVWAHGATLALVDNDYQLQEFEKFVEEQGEGFVII